MRIAQPTPDHKDLIRLILVYAATMGLAMSLFFVGANVAFLARFDIADLPYAFILSGLALIVINGLQTRLSASQLLVGSLAALAGATFALRIGLNLIGADGLVFALFPLFLLLIVTLKKGASVLVMGLFPAPQHTQLFNLMGISGSLGVIAGGVLIPIFAHAFGTDHLLLFAAAAILLCVWTVLSILDRYGDLPSLPQKSEAPPPLLKTPYLRWVLLTYSVAWIFNFLINFATLDRLQDEFGRDSVRMAAFMGGMFGLAYLVNLGLQALITRRLLSNYGVGVMLLVAPIVLTVGAAASAGIGAIFGTASAFFGTIILTKSAEEILRETVNAPSHRILYQPLPLAQRPAALASVEGWGLPLAALISGGVLILLTLTGRYGIMMAVGVLLVAAGVWLFAAWRTSQAYRERLGQALSRRLLRGEGLLESDPTTLAILKTKLKSQQAGEAIYALQMLEDLGDSAALTGLPDLLTHPAGEVRREALLRIEKKRPPMDSKLVYVLVESDSQPEVREAALRAYCALARGTAAEDVIPYLNDESPIIQRGALVGLLNYDDGEGEIAAEHVLHALSVNPTPTQRAFAAEVLGEIDNKRLYSYILNLLNDPDYQVQKSALLAAGRLNNPQLWPTIIKALTSAEVSTAAVSALFMANKAIYPSLESMFNVPAPNTELLVTIARICGRRRDLQAIELLERQFSFPDKAVHHQILTSLHLCGYQATPETRETIEAELESETVAAGWLLGAMADLEHEPIYQHLYAALRTEFEQTQRRLFLLLSFLYEAATIQRIRDNLALPSEDKRHYALELLNVLLPAAQRGALLPLLDSHDLTPSERLAQLPARLNIIRQDSRERLSEILQTPAGQLNAWIQACAIYAVATSEQGQFYEAVLPASESLEPLIRETALMALHRLDAERFMQSAASRATHWIQSRGESLMLLTIEKVLILKTVGIFGRVPDTILVEVASLLEEMELAAGETLFDEGDLGNALYIIIDGRVRVQTEKKVIAERGEREFIGEMSLFDDSPRSATVKAMVHTRLLRLGQEAFNELLANHPDMARSIIHVLATRLRESMQRHGVAPLVADILDKIRLGDGESVN